MPEQKQTERVFIANRGELALRVVRAARALGMETVVGASAADRGEPRRDRSRSRRGARCRAGARVLPECATHRACRRRHRLHGAASGLRIPLGACRPRRAVRGERHRLRRPDAAAMRAGGRQAVGARAGTQRQRADDAAAARRSRTSNRRSKSRAGIGYPVITKASAGGGGRGMVVARDAADLTTSFDTASTAAFEAFGDGTLYLERFVERARHVEVQVMGDGEGNVTHFGERDCSAQRRYQKMIEEAPAAILPDEVRARLHGRPCNCSAASAIATPAPSSSSTTRRGRTSTSWRSMRGCRSSTRSPRRSPARTWCASSCCSRPVARRCRASRTSRFGGHAIEVRILAEDPDRDFMPAPRPHHALAAARRRGRARRLGGRGRHGGAALLRQHDRAS